MKMTLDRIAAAVGAVGELDGLEGREIVRVQTDSRLVVEGDLFACLPGERFDGHEFAGQAESKGAGAILSQRNLEDVKRTPVLIVKDTYDALARLAAAWRMEAGKKVACVTGSAGKTTVKEMLYAALARDMETARNYKNWNNRLGVSLSILGTSGDEAAWVLELGISEPAEMAGLGVIARPDVVLIHNVGPAHLEALGDMAGVIREKTELLRHLEPEGQAVVSRDYPELWAAAKKLCQGVRSSSMLDETADFFAEYLGPAPAGGGRFRLKLEEHEMELALPFCGAHYAENLSVAAGGAWLMGASLTAIRQGLAATRLPEQRFACRTMGDWVLVDDSYNANPLSMERAIGAVREMAGDRPVHLVLGEMLELGDHAAASHRALGELAARAKVQSVFFHGVHAHDVEQGLNEAGYGGEFTAVETPGEFEARWRALMPRPGVVLVKGSRSSKMEDYVAACFEIMRSESDKGGLA